MPSRRAVSVARLPHEILRRIFSFLSIKDLAACMRVTRHWFTVLENYSSGIWEYHAHREIPEAALADPYIFGDLTSFKEKIRAFRFAWNPKDSSRNNFLRTNGLTVHRQPVAQSTDAIRGKISVSSGMHAWEIIWEGPLGTVAVIGVATKHAAMQCPGYIPLLGSDDQSWGWNLVDNQAIHNGAMRPYPGVNNPPKYQIGERIRMVLDCDHHKLYFERGSEFIGVAFTEIPPVKLYPAICAVYGNTEVTMIYMGQSVVG